MDSVTQVLLGVTISEAAFRPKLGKPANWLAAVSALLPDLDFILYPLDAEWWFMTNHRGLSHSFVVSFLAPFPLAWWFWRRTGRQNRYGLFWACSFAALFTHPILDLCTTYGTPVFLPFSQGRYAWDFIGIVDFIYSALLLAALAGCRTAWKRDRPRLGPWIASAGLLLSTGYIGLGALNHARAVGIARSAVLEEGLSPSRVEAFPMVGLVNVWRLVAETRDAFYVGRKNFLVAGGAGLARLPKDRGVLVEKAARHPRVQQYRRFALGMVRPVIDRAEGAGAVEFEDMRYALPADEFNTIWSVRVTFSPAGEIVGVKPEQERIGDHPPGKLIRSYWRELWH